MPNPQKSHQVGYSAISSERRAGHTPEKGLSHAGIEDGVARWPATSSFGATISTFLRPPLAASRAAVRKGPYIVEFCLQINPLDMV